MFFKYINKIKYIYHKLKNSILNKIYLSTDEVFDQNLVCKIKAIKYFKLY